MAKRNEGRYPKNDTAKDINSQQSPPHTPFGEKAPEISAYFLDRSCLSKYYAVKNQSVNNLDASSQQKTDRRDYSSIRLDRLVD